MEKTSKDAEERNTPSLTCTEEKQVFVIGGSESGSGERSVTRYSIGKDRWESMPDLSTYRLYGSACNVSGNLFVFAGMDESLQFINSIDKLSLFDVSNGLASWKLI